MEETASKEIYEDTHSLLREMLNEMSIKVETGLSFKFKPTEKSMSKSSVDLNFEYQKKEMIKDLTEYSTTEVRVSQVTSNSYCNILKRFSMNRMRLYLPILLSCALRTRALCG